MVKIGLLSDSINFPSLPLMKLSAWHKKQGDDVKLVDIYFEHFDKVYINKVFNLPTIKKIDQLNYIPLADEVVKGGSGYCIDIEKGKEIYHSERDKGLPYEIEHIYPDYELYGDKFKNHKFTEKYAKKLKKAQQHLSRKTRGSKQFEKQRLKVALIHEKIANCRSDVLHKISHKLVMQNDVVYLENLNIKGLSRSKLSKSVNDCSWGELTRQLHYKGDWDDTYIHEIDRFYPSSKTCHSCGYIMDKMPLEIRKWECPKCKEKHDRDVNAAINILLEGKREVSAGTTDYTDGEDVRPQSRKRRKADLEEVRISLL